MNWRVILAIGAVAIVGLVYGADYVQKNFFVELPDYPPITKAVWLDQNWSPKDREWYHHADQGTLTFGVPYEWFINLEQPTVPVPLIFSAAGRLSAPSYLDRYGFIPASTEAGDSKLPVGFAGGGTMQGPLGENPQTKQPMHGIGLTCAACHTGRFTYQGTTVLIDGGPALTNLGKLRTGLALSLLYTRYVPYRFDRFAENVLGDNASADAKATLRKQLDIALERVKLIKGLEDKVKPQSVEEGFARLDALNCIGNQVFALELNRLENYAGTSAPVHYPRIWNAPWFTWVQYNGSIEQPMVRNAGEALGVGAPIKLTGDKKGLYASGVKVGTLFAMEKLIAGQPQPKDKNEFPGLRSPKWPEAILGKIDTALAAKGAALYKSICQECHLPPVTSSEFWESKRWLPPNAAGERYFDVELINIKHIGTDPAQAEDMKNRKLSIPADLGITSNEFGPALGQVVEKTVNFWYDHHTPAVPQEQRDEINGHRKNGIQAPLAYKVRPLNGIWATPPYLHNGSVPNLYALLSPASERPKTFYLGNREYDPVNVGYRTEELAGGFKFDTSIRGNHNTGHEFNDDKTRQGVIGRRLKPDERRALIEYLKTQ